MTAHVFFEGKLQLYLRAGSVVWQSAATVGGKRFRASTGESNFKAACTVAEEWYFGLRGKLAAGLLETPVKERTFGEASDAYLREIRVLSISNRSPKYIDLMALRLKAHITPHFGNMPLSEVSRGVIKTYCVKRYETTIAKKGKPPARNTMLHELVHIRQILKYANGQGWIDQIPLIDTEFLRQTKKGRRAWFSPEEYKQLYTATRRRITEGKRPGYKSHYEDMHDYVLFQANTGLRPDEAANLEIRDVKVVEDYGTGETILEIDVRGKVGVGYAKSTTGAVHPYHRLFSRRLAELEAKQPHVQGEELSRLLAHTKLFRKFDSDLFNIILREEGLKHDRDGRSRTAYSLRHTYISMRLMEGAPIWQVAINCRTSVEMIQEHYAAHIKDRIDASALNVVRPKPARLASARTRGETLKKVTLTVAAPNADN